MIKTTASKCYLIFEIKIKWIYSNGNKIPFAELIETDNQSTQY